VTLTPEKFKKYATIAVGLTICALIAPGIYLALKGIAGLIAAFVICSVAIALMPAFTQAMTNLKFKAFTEVVSRAPIESLYAEQEESFNDLQEASKGIEEQMEHIEIMSEKVKAYAKKQTDPDQLASWQSRLSDYERLLAHNVELFKAAKTEHAKYGPIIDIAEMEWDMAKSDAKLAKAFGKKDDFMRNLRQKTALEAVQKASAASRARLRMALVNQEQTMVEIKDTAPVHAITYDTRGKVNLGNILDVQPISVPREGNHGPT
jgi:hypothetical protein